MNYTGIVHINLKTMATKNQEQSKTAKNSSRGSKQSQGTNIKNGNSNSSGSKSSSQQSDRSGSKTSQKSGSMNERDMDEK